MKALYITYDGLADPLGQSQVLPYIKGLSDQADWTILSFEKKDADPKVASQLSSDLNRYKIKWLRASFGNRIPVLSRFVTIFRAIASVFSSGDQFDVVHVRSYVAAMIGLIVKKRHRSKFIFDIRGFWPEEQVFRGKWSKRSLQFLMAKLMERSFLKNADTVVVLTHRAKDILNDRSKYPKTKNIVMIPTCVDLARFHNDPVSLNGIRLCYSGSLGTWYCLDEMLAFFDHMRSAYPAAKLDFLVNWTSYQSLSAKELSLFESSKQISIQTTQYNELPKFLARSNIGLFFIRSTFSKQASCPTKLGEFLAMGMPVIVNRGVGDYDQWVKNEGLGIVIDDFSHAAFEKAIQKMSGLLLDRGIQERCRTFAKKHLSLDLGIQRYRSIYQ